jgi:hypothetical protein
MRLPNKHVSALTRCARRRQFSQTLNVICPRNPRRRLASSAPPARTVENRNENAVDSATGRFFFSHRGTPERVITLTDTIR